MNSRKKKGTTFWIIFIALGSVIFEAASYFSTGNFIMCGRYNGTCSQLTPDDFFRAIWSIVAIVIGCYSFFSTDDFIAGNARRFRYLHNKTHLAVFKQQAEAMSKSSRIFVKAMGLFFIVLGILVMFGQINFS